MIFQTVLKCATCNRIVVIQSESPREAYLAEKEAEKKHQGHNYRVRILFEESQEEAE